MCKYEDSVMSSLNPSVHPWQSPEMQKHGSNKTIPQPTPQILLLTVEYPSAVSSSSNQIFKAINSLNQDVSTQSHVLLQQVDNLLPFNKSPLSEGVKLGTKCTDGLIPLLVLKPPTGGAEIGKDVSEDGVVTSSFTDVLIDDNHQKQSTLDGRSSPSHAKINFSSKLESPEDQFRNSPIISFESTSLSDFTCNDKADRLELEDEEMELSPQRSNLNVAAGMKEDIDKGIEAINEDINLPNALCSVGWETDSCSDDDDRICHVISDKPVVCRAKATLPANYLYFSQLDSDGNVGVFARKKIAKRSQFGPFDGVLKPEGDLKEDKAHPLVLTVEQENGSMRGLDVSNQELSNWMCFVRPALTQFEQNVALSQTNNSLYFTTTKAIQEGEELKVWYSTGYASTRFLPILSGSPEGKWQCPKCSYKNNSSDIISTHISSHKTLQVANKISKTLRNNSSSRKNLKLAKKGNLNFNKTRYGNQDSSSDSSSRESFKDKWCCTHCERCFNTATMLNFHMLAHAADNLEAYSPRNLDDYQCSECSQSQFDEECVEQENKPIVCELCSKSFRTTSALACHLKSHSDEKKFECPICNQLFDKVLELKSHIHTHSKNGVFTCTQCSKEFTVYKHIRKHIRAFHSEKIYPCSVCGKKFQTMDKLKPHQLTHSDKRQFSCTNCGKQFKRKDKLSEHMKKIHFLDKGKLAQSSTQDKIDKKFSDKVLRGEYVQFVYKCHICVVGFKRRGMLVNHIANRHPDITLESVPELNLPILKPTKDYYCQYCDKIYKSSSKRRAHILKYHPGAKLPLSNRQLGSVKGGATEIENGTFSQTVGSVTTDPQGCQWCHKQYASKAKLLQHQRKKHLNLLPKSLQAKKKATAGSGDEGEQGDQVRKVAESKNLFQDSLVALASEYEISDGDGNFVTESEFIVDGPTLKKALRWEVSSSAECFSESGLEQLITESRPDQYFKVTQMSSGITVAQPIEIWDQLSLSPTNGGCGGGEVAGDPMATSSEAPPVQEEEAFLPAFNPR